VQQKVVMNKLKDWEGLGGEGSGTTIWAFFK